MAGTKGDETNVEGHEEIEGRKRVNEDKDVCPAKRAKVEGEAAGDGTKEEEEEEEVNNTLERLRGLLADEPKMLNKKDVEEIINHLNVEEIISLALKANQGKGSDEDNDGATETGKWPREDEDWGEKALNTVRFMLGSIEFTESADIRHLYEKWPPKAFATVLLAALDSSNRNSTDSMEMVEYYDIIPKLCDVLPWKLFAYVLAKKGVMDLDDEMDEEEISRMQKEEAERCDFCKGKGEHTGKRPGTFCSLMDAIPKGTTVPPGYWVECGKCGYSDLTDTFDGCLRCGWEVGKAERIPIRVPNNVL